MKANGEVTCGKGGTSHLNGWTKSSGERGEMSERKKKEKKGQEEISEKLQLLSRIHVDQVVGSGRSKRQSWSTQPEIHVGTKISGFHQLREVGVFLLFGLILT